MLTRCVTVARIKPEYWRMIQDGRKHYEIRDEAVDFRSLAFVFVDADSETYLGCARIKSATRFGGDDATPWDWSMLSLLSSVPVDELKELFSWVLRVTDAQSECEMYAYEVEPIGDDQLFAFIANGTFADQYKKEEA